MNRQTFVSIVPVLFVFAGGFLAAGCARGAAQEGSGAPPPAEVEHEETGGVSKVDHPEQFPLAAAEEYESRPALSVTGVVSPDVSRSVPVWSMVSGRAVDLGVRLGDQVRAGQLLVRIQSSEISSALSDYRHAVTDEALTRVQLDRAKALYERGAVAQKDLEVAQDAEDKAKVDVETAAENLRVLGGNPDRQPTATIDVMAPVAGVITEQNVTNAAAIKAIGDSSNDLFTISDLSRVWVVCDVYENDLASVHIGDSADVRLNAYPDRALTGRVSNVLPVLDPNIRTAKVRIELSNPGFMRVGMFATAIFHGQTMEMRTIVPATAILHMHDRDWVYVPAPGNTFKRLEVVGGDSLPGGKQEVRSGLKAGQQVVSNALVLDRTITQ